MIPHVKVRKSNTVYLLMRYDNRFRFVTANERLTEAMERHILSAPCEDSELDMLRLSYEEQESIENAGLTERHARALLRLSDESKRREALSRVISEGLNVSQTESLVSQLIQSTPKPSGRGRRCS